VVVSDVEVDGYRSSSFGPFENACACITILGGPILTSNYDLEGDVNGDALVDGDDIKAFVECLLTGETVAGDCVCADLDGNAVVNEADAELFVGLLLGL